MVNEATIGEAGYEMAEFVITFAYTVRGREYQGKYKAASPQEEASTFEILFDPLHPERNTGADPTPSLSMRIAVGAVFALLFFWITKLFGFDLNPR